MGTFERKQKEHDAMEDPRYWSDKDDEPDDLPWQGMIEKAFAAGFDAACNYWENPTLYENADINEYQEKELKKTLHLLG